MLKSRLFGFCLIVFFLIQYPFVSVHAQICAAPYNPTPATSWGMVQKFQSNALIWNGGTPTAADLNGDGISEILAPASDYSGYYVYKGDGTNKTTATKDFVITTSSARSVQPAIANIIGDATTRPEVVMVNASGFLYIFANTGGTETNFLFKSTTASQYTTEATPYIVDIDEDGTPEIVIGSDVFGIVGNALVKRVAGPALGYIGQTSGSTGTPVDVIVADIISTNPGKELIYGSRVYRINLATGVTTILKDLSTIVGTSLIAANDNGPTAIADMNGDGKLDIVYNGSSFVVMWDPNGTTAANTLLFRRIPPSFIYGVRGLPLIANVFDDKTTGGKSTDLPEAVIINSSGGSSGIVTAYNLNYNTTAGTATQYIWSLATNDMSGCTGITAFDFDGNGLREIVYRDQSTLRIINGNRTTPVNYATEAVSSATWGEYPIVADLNNDGQAEIAVTGNSMLQVFGSDPATFPWKGAPSYWNQRNYRIVNINSNLTIPATEDNAASSIAYNNNAAQFQFADAVGNGVPSGFTYAPDARITINTVTTDCPRITVTATISNSGSFVLPAGTSVAMYDANPTTGAANLIGTFQTTASIAAGASQAVTMTANLVSLSTTVFAVVNDRGTTARPFNLSSWTPNTGINECTYTNNMDSKTFTCIDSDGDSVVDYVDIDDDNDGILDTSEQSGSCANVTLTPFSATSSPVYGGSTATKTIDGSGFTGTGLAALASSPAVLENAWLLKEPETSGFIEYLMPSGSNVGGVALWAPDAFNYGGGDGPPKDFRVEVTYEGGRIFTSQVFTTAQPNSSGALPGAQAFYFPKALFNVTKIRLNILNGWYDINNNSIGQVSTDGITVNAAYNMFLGEFRAICGTADIDTDNDGIPNRLDLDSDGDGCTDATEAGVTGTLNSGSVKNGANGAVTSTTTIPNAITAGLYGTNGLANSLETTVDNGVINYTSTYAYATMRGYASCVDTDTDGINDLQDVDDDNDGILDVTELSCTSPLSVEVPTIAGATSIFSDNNSGNFIKLGGSTLSKISTTLYETSIDVVQFAGTSSGSIVLNNTYQQLKIVIADLDQSESVTLKVYDVLGNLIPLSSSNIFQKGSYVNPTYPSGSSIVLTSVGAATYDGSTNSISNILFEVPYAAKRIEIYKTAGSNNTWVGLFAGCNDGDTDNDGIPNRLDLDSDGDGCSDALESGATTNATANFAFTGTMGTNGLVNSLETVADNGTINYTSTYDFANSKNYAACVDTDGDSITDVIDIDDDNDGILDAVESPNCFYSRADWLSGNRSDITVSTTLAMNATYGSPYKLVDGDNGTAAANYAVNFIASTTAGQTVYAFKMPVPVELKTIYLGYINANTHFNTGTVLRLEGSNDNTSWTTLGNGYGASTSVPGLAGSLTANTFSVTQNTRKYLFYRIYWVSGGGVNANGYSNEVYFEVPANYQSSLNPKLDCISDLDNDGKANHLDLDSDSDGCSDAIEGGSSATATNISVFPTGTDTNSNGLLNQYEGTTAGFLNYNATYDFALSAAFNLCLDSDSDGVVDYVDLDDDNDGVLDNVESPSCFFTNQELQVPIAVSSELTQHTTSYVIGNSIDANTSTASAFTTGQNWVGKEIFKFTAADYVQLTSMTFDLVSWALSANGSSTFKLQGSTDNQSWTDLSAAISSSATTGTLTISNTLATTAKFKFFRLIGVAGTSSYGGVLNARFVVPVSANTVYPKVTCSENTDSDSKPNHLDHDSDGDGCSDAVEAGTAPIGTTAFSATSFFNPATTGTNGFADALETSPTSGIYKGTYTYLFASTNLINTCIDTDVDGVGDFIDLDDDNDGVTDIKEMSCTLVSSTNGNCTAEQLGAAVYGIFTHCSGWNAFDFDPSPTAVDRADFDYMGLSGTDPYFDLQGSYAGPNITGKMVKSFSTTAGLSYTFEVELISAFGDDPTTGSKPYLRAIDASTGVILGTTYLNGSGIRTVSFMGIGSSTLITLGYDSRIGNIGIRFWKGGKMTQNGEPFQECTVLDTDNDGRINSLDLDSDGDGCADAIEASSSTTERSTSVFPTGTDTNGNGLLNNYESNTTAGTVNYTSTYTNFAIVNTVNACLDTDGDGIGDVLDLDDDNDGVLDTTELACAELTISKTGLIITKPATINYTFNGNTIANLIDGVDANVYVASGPSGTLNNSPWFNFEFPTPKALGYLEIGHYVGQQLFATGSTYKIQGSTDNTNWIDVSGTLSYNNIATSTSGGLSTHNSNIANFPSNITAYKYYRIYGIAATSGGGWATEIFFKENVCSWDIDNDGKINSLDLDSDGDGCADAIEAGSSTTATSTSTFPSGADANRNGLLTIYEGTTAGTVNYTSTYANYALSNTVNACLDTDSDGIKNVVDLDDDNDGVLDVVEQSCVNAVLSKSGITISSTVNWVFQNAPTGLNSLLDGNLIQQIYPSETNLNNKTILQFNLPSQKVLNLIELANNNNQTPLIAGGTYKIQGSNDGGTTWVDIVASQVVANSLQILATTNSIKFDMPKNVSAFSTYRVLGISITGQANWSQEVYFRESVCTNIDTDNDGTPNHLDLDSDGDGCADAIEAGSSTTATSTSVFPTGTDTNSNGLLNNYETGTTGMVNYTSSYASYALTNAINACTDTDSDGVRDIFDLDDDNDGVLDSIENGPFGCVVSPACVSNASLSASVSATGTPPTGWTNFANGGSVDINQGNWQISYGQATPSRTLFPAATANTFFIYGMSKGGSGSLGGWAPYGEAFQQTLNCLTVGQTYYLSFRGAFTHSPGVNAAVSYETTPTAARFVLLRDGTQVSQAPDQLLEATQQMVTLSFVATATTHTIAIAHTADLATDLSLMVIEAGSGYLCTSKPASSNEALDTDGDGIPNRLDLDSDGDGCSDAVEAKTVTSLTATTVSGGFGTNGFADNLETSGNGVYTGTYVYSRATDPTVKACLDSDFDGVPDIDDLDDDNDGILDSNECSAALMIENNAANLGQVSRKSWTLAYIVEQDVNSFAGGTFGALRAEATQNVYGEVKLPPASTPVIKEAITSLDIPSMDRGTVVYREVFVKIPSTAAFTNASQISFRVGKDNLTWNAAVLYVAHTGASITATTPAGGGGGNTSVLVSTNSTDMKIVSQGKFSGTGGPYYQGGAFITSPTNAGKWVRMALSIQDGAQSEQASVQYSLNGSGTWNPVDVANGFQFAATEFSNSLDANKIVCDFDGDGIPNSQDLDSDGDGCSDANEYYGNTTAQGTDGNSYYGTGNPPTVDATGKVTTASYSGNNTNVTTAGAATIITTQPSNQTLASGANATFSATVTAGSGTTNYQWQVSTDGGSVWANVANTGVYTGATTSTLTLTGVSNSMNEYRYRLQISQSNYVCGNISSNVVRLVISNNPKIIDNSATIAEDVTLTGNVLTNDTGSGTPAASLTVNTFTVGGVNYTAGQTATIPNVGTIVVNANGTFTFIPAPNYNGQVPPITYTATDTNGGTGSGTLTITVTPVNDPPVAVNETTTTPQDTPLTDNVLTNDTDADGNILSVSTFTVGGVTYNAGESASIPGVGTIVVNTNGTYTFTPAFGYVGLVPVIGYGISDAKGGTTNATLTITVTDVNDAPLPSDDIKTTTAGTTATGNVLTNDTDVENNPLSVTQFTIAGISATFLKGQTATIANVGTILIAADGTYTFVPVSGFSGDVPIITYTITDGGITKSAKLDIYVAPVNANPVAVNDAQTINEDTNATGNLLTNDTDSDANTTLKVTQYSFTIGSTVYTYPAGSTASIPGVGIIVVNANGTYTFTPNANYNGAVPAINYVITDNDGAIAAASLTITITPVNDNPVAANDDNLTGPEDTPITGNVLTNDTDPEGSAITVTQFTIAGISGTFTAGTTATIPNVGTLVVNADGTFTFTPATNYNGTVPAITYTVQDSSGATDTANLNLAIIPINDVPDAVNDDKTIPEGTAAAGNVLTNDTDPESNTLTVTSFTINGVTYSAGSLVTIPNVGTVKVNTDGSYTFTPEGAYFGTVPLITYTISDGNGGSDSATLAITVTSVNDPPKVENETITTPEDTPLTGNVLTNDTDPESDPISVTNFTVGGVTYTAGQTATIPGVGTIVVNANGTYTFTPALNYNGVVPVIGYAVSDGAFTVQGSLSIVVTPVNDVPIIVNESQTTPQNTPAAGNVLLNDSDLEGDNLTLTQFTVAGITGTFTAGQTASIPGVGTLVVNADGTYTFTPATNYYGSVPATTYSVSDGNGGTATGILSLSVTPVDTDGDGVMDFQEILDGTSPTDSCSFKSTSQVLTPSTAWRNADCDGDGTPNGTDTAPLNPCVHAVGAIPDTANAIWAAADCDGDGESNGTETTNGTNPNDACSYTTAPSSSSTVWSTWSALDCDSDGVTNGTEITNGTNPLNPDTDGDGNPDNTDTRPLIPTATNDSASVNSGSSVVVNILTNDDYLANDGNTITKTGGTAAGTVTFDPVTGTMTYVPTTAESGTTVTVIYTVCQGTVCATATVTITVVSVDADGDGVSDAQEGIDGTNPNNPCSYNPTSQVLSSTSAAWKAADCDGDGTPNGTDTNPLDPCVNNGTSTPDATNAIWAAADCDNDGIPNAIDGLADTDGDGIPNYKDLDSDADGIPDSIEDSGCTGTSPCTPTDTDGDGTPDYRDLDSDNDGITDSIEKGPSGTSPVDTDGDGTPDYRDLDSDGDGISDAIEKGTGLTPVDTDGDGIPNYLDLDSDGDGISDAIEKGTGATPVDTDGDGTPDYRDTDSDGDGISDALEKGTDPLNPVDTDGDGTPDYRDLDSDGDGISDSVEKGTGLTPVDTDGDGTPDYRDTDSDNDGILDSIEKGPGVAPLDTDGDGTPDYRDLDSDNDGISDAIEKGPGLTPVDTDGNGTPDYRDLDSDGDGKTDAQEGNIDTDGDGTPNFRDLDSDGDGVLDSVDQCPLVVGTAAANGCPPDFDGDGIIDAIDLDDDNDGILDTLEAAACSPVDPECDTDGDGIPNRLDSDSDNDGISDVKEAGGTDTDNDGKVDGGVDANGVPLSTSGGLSPPDTDGDGKPNPYDIDSDGDGISDAIEKGANGNNPADTDSDGTPDYLDLDSDGDGISDAIEKGPSGTSPLDTDGDGTPDFRDLDSDGDGISDAIEKGTGLTPVDTDGDGTPDYRDTDSDNDGILDSVEKGSGLTPVDTDGDGTPDYRDTDSDNDGILDSIEKGTGTTPVDTDGDGTPDYRDTDSDNDGILDSVEKGAGSTPVDTDGDGTPDYRDTDSDNDGILDSIEKGTGATPVDTDGDGTPDYRDLDSDNDGISDVIEKGSGLTPVDTDGDGTPDYRDLDSDGDGKTDAQEGNIDTDGDGTPNYRDLDSDGDGVLDSVDQCPLVVGTAAANGCPPDFDGDGIADAIDLDDDNDGILDTLEAAACSPVDPECDTDGDGIPNRVDSDSDNDGISDVKESGGTDANNDGRVDGGVDANGVPLSTNGGLTPPDTDGDGKPNPYDLDSDGDGISDAIEKGANGNNPVDTDGDGKPDYLDLDSDNDGIPDSVEKGTGSSILDTDGDGTPDYKDLDSDNDGISDAIEKGANGATPLDTDGDGTPDYRDTDSDNDGILDAVEKGSAATPLDTDGDGTPDYRDTDSDNDGILDAVEKGTGNTPIDTDGDGTPDYRDTDSDNDGILDAVEKGAGTTPVDTDGDGTPDYRDTDSDNDGIPDSVEKGPNGATPLDTDGDGKPDYLDVDSDNDGIPDSVEKGTDPLNPVDTDGDGTPDYRDLDSDNDGISDAIEKGANGAIPVDTDSDGIPDYRDLDSDGDGKPDSQEGLTDTDGDGLPNYRDTDSDNDGVLDANDQCPYVEGTALLNGCPPDTDGDGLTDNLDLDDDNDGILDTVENGICNPTSINCDTDGDGIPNRLDPDSDNDGISDVKESNGTDTNGDGKVDGAVDSNGIPVSANGGVNPPNTDGDGKPNPYDLDSDGDGISDAIEKGANGNNPVDTDGDGTPDYLDLDSDNDGIPDKIEKGTGTSLLDTDGDGTPDYRDVDSDNDGIPDSVEKGPNGTRPLDTDGDGTPDYRDLDSDNDGLLDAVEKGANGNVPVDTDNDGTPDYRDVDSDGDGVLDFEDDCPLTFGLAALNGCTGIDSDNDGIPDAIDLDDDNDGITDIIENAACSPSATKCDTDGDGIINSLDLDSDGDGITDARESNGTDVDGDGRLDGPVDTNGVPNSANGGVTPPDTDGDGKRNPYDVDSDGDGIPDSVEKGANPNAPVDTDGDGTPDYLDLDSDNDGIPDSVEKGPNAAIPLDTDGDGIPNYRDLDSDGDGIPDSIEKGPNGATPLDTDADGIPDYRDTDSDNDGIPDTVEKGPSGATPVDTDADGIPDYRDTDSDGDGIPDSVEKGPNGATPVDTDGDGIPDYRDLDSDGDGIPDTVEKGSNGATPLDTDGDGIPDYRDTDSDNDGIPDSVEKGPNGATPVDTDGDGKPDYLDTDSDNDGIPDSVEKGPNGATPVDTDGDGIPDYRDTDSDGDGIPDSVEKGPNGATPVDTDGDGKPDYLDTDSDGDGIPDTVEKGPNGATPVDTDGDGIPDYRDTDSDGDGIPDSVEKGPNGATPLDTDGDGKPDYLDLDSDGDGIPDSVEKGANGAIPLDTDGDGKPDYLDLDSDGDGIPDSVEKGANGATLLDTDGDGIPDYRDTDSDNDGIPDSVEKGANGATPVDTDGDGKPDYLDTDSDGDGIPDSVEKGPDGTQPLDTDGDGKPDYLDTDSDGDGIPDSVEKGADGTKPLDTDGDGKPDYLDLDSDNDGIPDSVEKGPDGTKPLDTDGDGIPDYRDTDSDNDGIPDSVEKGPNGAIPLDTDADGIPDYLDTDSDNDGIPDSVEKGLDGTKPVDTDGDGIPDYRDLDSDGDGIPDSIEKGPDGTKPLDTDGDGIPDYRDLDSDGDGIPDSIERGPNGATPLDTDGDGIPDYRDLDSDGDGIPDSIEKGSNGATPLDTDGDGIPDYRDLDSDNDGIPDSVEKGSNGNKPVDTDGDGIPDYRDLDSDGDGASDADELKDQTNPLDACSFKLSSQKLQPSASWNAADCDGDGVSNGTERLDGTNVLDGCDFKVSSRTLQPSAAWKAADCDGDGLNNEKDGIEDCNLDGIPNFKDPKSCQVDILLPKVFTPNGDGINDVIKPILLGIKQFVCFKVYNRWGNLIFETTDQNVAWDGNYRTQGQGTETFQWLSEGYDAKGILIKRMGLLTLLR